MSGLRFVVSSLRFEVWESGFGVWVLGFWGLGLGCGVWVFGFGVWGLGFWGLDFGCGVWVFGFGVWGSGLGVWGLTSPRAFSGESWLRKFAWARVYGLGCDFEGLGLGVLG